MSTIWTGLGSIVGPIIGFLLGLIPLILIHEFGHLIAGRTVGIWAREFGVGYPPRILKLFRWKETDFTLNLLPLGGFTRFEGEKTFDDGQNHATEPGIEEHSLYAKGPWQRIVVYLGGSVANLLTAWLIAVLIFVTGIPQTRPVITEVVPGSPAAMAALQPGDQIVAVNGDAVEDTRVLQERILAEAGTPTSFTVERDGAARDLVITPRANPPEGQGALGILIATQEITGTLKHYPVTQAVTYGSRYFANVAATTVMLPVYVVRMGIPFAQARPVGVIGISQIADQSVDQSIEQNAPYPFLNILVLLSISLGIFNLLPIPALDGGRILFALVEAIRGKALTPALEERIHLAALLLLVAMFIAVTVLDIVMPVQLQ
ncbi:MAG: M50 family metallopeptidase [Anaerolineae bacterium]|nr:M50 family metallopeptidase [Anaerolineae bacterium]